MEKKEKLSQNYHQILSLSVALDIIRNSPKISLKNWQIVQK
ncbi:MAG: hypothetical protein ABW185_08005 [Sedimenticola sp.]